MPTQRKKEDGPNSSRHYPVMNNDAYLNSRATPPPGPMNPPPAPYGYNPNPPIHPTHHNAPPPRHYPHGPPFVQAPPQHHHNHNHNRPYGFNPQPRPHPPHNYQQRAPPPYNGNGRLGPPPGSGPPSLSHPMGSYPLPPQQFYGQARPLHGPPSFFAPPPSGMAVPMPVVPVVPPGDTTTAVVAAAIPATTFMQPQHQLHKKVMGKKKRRPHEAKRTKKRTTGDSSKPAAPSWKWTIASDEAPDRITNPLFHLPVPPKNDSIEEPMNGAELYDTTELVYCRPDTYPLSYLARVLGFDVPIPDLEQTQPFPTPLPETLKLRTTQEEDPFLKIPNLGRAPFPQQTTKENNGKIAKGVMGDLDDQQTLDYMDPVYRILLQHGFQPRLLKVASANLVSKFAQKQQQQASMRQTIIKQAVQMLDGDDSLKDWTFSDWTSYTSAESNTLQKPRWTIDGQKVFSNPPPQAFGIIASYKGQAVTVLKYQFQWYPINNIFEDDKNRQKESELFMIMDGIGQRTMAKPSKTTSSVGPKTPTQDSTEIPGGTAVEEETEAPKTNPATAGNAEPSAAAAQSAVPPADATPSSKLPVKNLVKESEEEGFYDAKENEDGSAMNNERTPTSGDPNALSIPTQIQMATPAGATTNEQLIADLEELQEAPLPSVQVNDSVFLVMIALALEHTRACDVWYSLWDCPQSVVPLNTNCFRMVKLPRNEGQTGEPMVCDLKKCSSRYALLLMKQDKTKSCPPTTEKAQTYNQERLLVRFPAMEEAKACFDPKFAEMQRSMRAFAKGGTSRVFTSAPERVRQVVVGVRAKLPPQGEETKDETEKPIKLIKLGEDGTEGEEIKPPQTATNESHQLDILRCFSIRTSEPKEGAEDEVLMELKKKQDQLIAAEKDLEPRLHALMAKLVDQRRQYVSSEAIQKRAEEKRILAENLKIVERRKEMDLAWQEQLEQDMNAVCNICNDGEVTPDNQILFCEACNVAVHQMCYGIEEVPEGDYYCIACRYFQREKMSNALVGKAKRSKSAERITLPPLPICCELCPIKQGAYIRTDTSKSAPNSTTAKWVHMACAKWQGLDFAEKLNPEVVEDITLLKQHFRRMDIRCCICQGKRGSYINCRLEGCENWLHVTCARAVLTCDVAHGEDVEGAVTENPWTLMCPEHSEIDPETLTREPVPVNQLVQAANQFPVDPMPEPLVKTFKAFNKMSGKERAKALADPEYEEKLLKDLTTKKLAGVRCEVCSLVEDDGKNLSRCNPCGAVVCFSCRLTGEEVSEEKVFTCFGCRYFEQKEREKEEYETPKCHLCVQKGGLLLNSFANPVNRQTYWRNNPKEFEKTIFARKLWAHATCAFWLKNLEVNDKKCTVDCSNVVMSQGKGYVHGKVRCGLCGSTYGHKAKCSEPGCRVRVHVTCARQAGFEVFHDDYEANGNHFYVRCYNHGGNEYNLRARLEDLIETEKRRAGKTFLRKDKPMMFPDASRILNHSFLVLGMLGWAWRWAELWVEYGSNWEPLLEPGQEEEKMTKRQLKIVDSTPESRCADARRCRLAAFGAALRNRIYDTEHGFDGESLDRALRAVLHTKSLVGPLKEFEIDFFAEWLGRAYRSKSRLTGLGDDKIPVENEAFCAHLDDNSPKHELGSRRLPGKNPLEDGQVFEDLVEEPDDFLKPETMENGKPSIRKKELLKQKSSAKRPVEDVEEYDAAEPPKKRHVPPKTAKGKAKGSKTSMKSSGQPDSPRMELTASVAAVVPSAVRKRGDRRARDQSVDGPNVASPIVKVASQLRREIRSPRKAAGFPVRQVSILYEDIKNNPESALKSSRGRKPKVLELAVFMTIRGEDYNPLNDEGVTLSECFEKAIDDESPEKTPETTKDDSMETQGHEALASEVKELPQAASSDPSKGPAEDTKAGEPCESDPIEGSEQRLEKKVDPAPGGTEQTPLDKKDGMDLHDDGAETTNEGSGDKSQNIQIEKLGDGGTAEPVEASSKPEESGEKQKITNDLKTKGDMVGEGEEAGACDSKEPKPTPTPKKKKRGRPPWKHLAKNSEPASTKDDEDVVSDRESPSRPKKEIASRRSTRDSPAKQMSLKEAGTDSETEVVENVVPRRKRPKKRAPRPSESTEVLEDVAPRHKSPGRPKKRAPRPSESTEVVEDAVPRRKSPGRPKKRSKVERESPVGRKKKKPSSGPSGTSDEVEQDESPDRTNRRRSTRPSTARSMSLKEINPIRSAGYEAKNSPPKKKPRLQKRVRKESDASEAELMEIFRSDESEGDDSDDPNYTVTGSSHASRSTRTSTGARKNLRRSSRHDGGGNDDGVTNEKVSGEMNDSKESNPKSAEAPETSEDTEKKETEEEINTPKTEKPAPEPKSSPKRRGRPPKRK